MESNKKRFNRRGGHYRQHEGQQLYNAEMRAFIALKLREGCTVKKIAAILSVAEPTVRSYMAQSMQRATEMHSKGEDVLDMSPKERTNADLEATSHRKRIVKRGPGPGPHVVNSPKGEREVPAGSSILGPIASTVISGQVLLPDEEVKFQRLCFHYRKLAWPFDEIAHKVGRSEAAVRDAVRTRLAQLDAEELVSTEGRRRLMVEQIDTMIRAILPHAIGETADGVPVLVDYDAIDRMVKLLDRKAKLEGLDQPQKVDIRVRIEQFAEEAGYDVDEIKQIAEEVIADRARQLSGR